MQRLRASILLILPAILVGFVSFEPVDAQPHGWPCDYGYRPGNTWFYRSTSFTNGYSETVERDSMGADGSYWVYITQSIAPPYLGYWYRINSSCIFDLFIDPWDDQFQHYFIPTADSGEGWVVDSVFTQPPLHARIYAIYYPLVFGRRVQSKDVVYYPADTLGDGWYNSAEWAEGIGIIRRQRHPSGYDELVGAIIDGVAYGSVSSVSSVDSHEGLSPLQFDLTMVPLRVHLFDE